MKVAQLIGKYQGKRVYRYPYKVVFSGLDRQYWEISQEGTVVSQSAADAAWFVKEQVRALGVDHPFEIHIYGPKGGKTSRFEGWESVIGSALMRRASPQQPLFA